MIGVVRTELTPTSAVRHLALSFPKDAVRRAEGAHNSAACTAIRTYARDTLRSSCARATSIAVRSRVSSTLVPALVPPAEKLHQVMHAHYLLVLGVPPAASTHRAPLLHAALHAARFHATDSGHHLSVCVSSSAGLFG